MIDVFYTPTHVAHMMISHVQQSDPKIIADFAAGDAKLLEAAYDRWKHAEFIAADLDPKSIRRIRRRHPRWRVGTCDFLNQKSRSRCAPLRNSEQKVSLILLNPPFSYRGGRRYEVVIDGVSLSCTKAMAFVATSIKYMSSGAELLAVVPAGTMHAERDAAIWTFLSSRFDVTVVAAHDRRTFDACTARTVVIRLARREETDTAVGGEKVVGSQSNGRASLGTVEIIRGVVQMHTVNGCRAPDGFRFIHSTELRSGEVRKSSRRTTQERRVLMGPAVLLPRVGQLRRDKIALYLSGTPVVLSDCVIALRCRSKRQATAVRTLFMKNWDLLERAYGGTCAKYITLSSLVAILASLNLSYRSTSKITGQEGFHRNGRIQVLSPEGGTAGVKARMG
jgi:hypothetical protein